MAKQKTYIAIDLKSFYASVECVERGLDPLKNNLVVADEGRTEKTICLAVSPSLKAHGISGRARLFEVIERVKQVNNNRKLNINYADFKGESYNADELKDDYFKLSYIVAPPRMNFYKKYSNRIFAIQVHAVRARAEHAAHARRTEGQLGIESILDFLLVARDGLQLIDGRLIVRKFLEPGFICFTIRHGFHPPSRL